MKIDTEELSLAQLALEYADETKARELLEAWVWPKGPICPHCKSKDVFRLKPQEDSKSPCRQGVLKCAECRKQFTVTVGTVMEKTKIPLSKWMMAAFILSSSKKGVSAHQLHRMIGITYKSAWFLFHRLRHAMQQKPLRDALKGVVEADDAYIGGTPERGKGTHGRGTKHKTPIVALVERGGKARVKIVAGVSANNLRKFVADVVSPTATVNSDQWNAYKPLFREFKHDVVQHNVREFSRHNADGSVTHVNTCESLFSLIKRGMVGSFHHVSKEHLPRYIDEFVFRWDRRKLSDGERTSELMQNITDKRLTYREVVA